MTNDSSKTGIVFLVGSGPGDPDLITVKGARLLEACDAVVYDALAPDELVVSLPQRVEKRYVGKKAGQHSLPQDQINELLVALAREGKKVVRLKGGDPFVFGRGGEEAEFLKEHGIPFEIVPGITAGVAGPAYAGIPTTDRRKASFVMFLTGHKASDKELSSVPWDWVGRAKNGTLVVYMGVSELGDIVAALRKAGMDEATPAAAIERGTYPTQRVIPATVATLQAEVKRAGLKPPSLFVFGDTVELHDVLSWMDTKPLFGLRVLVARPSDQAGWVYRDLRDLGAEVLPYPTIATEEVNDPAAWESLSNISGDNRWLLFTSENGVRFFLNLWRNHKEDVRGLASFKIAAVGFGTARALKRYNLSPDFMPTKATTAELARQMTDNLPMKGATVVRVRGNLGDNRVEDILRQAEATVIPVPVYRTFNPTWTPEAKEKLFAYPPDVIMLTSGSTVSGLVGNLTSEELKTLCEGAVVQSIGPSTSETIKSHGIPVSLEAETHSIPSMIEDLVVNHRRKSLKRSP